MHTAGLVDFLARDGYEVRHFYAQHAPWRIGGVADDGLAGSQAIEFAESEWNVPRFASAFAPQLIRSRRITWSFPTLGT